MTRRHIRFERSIFSLAGWLFADLLLVLALVFLATSSPWIAGARAKPQPTPSPVICGMDKVPQFVTVAVSDPSGLRVPTQNAIKSFAANIRHSNLTRNAKRIAGLVEVFGGSADVGDGVSFASGAIIALKAMIGQHFIFSSQTAFFKPLWDGTLRSNQVSIYVFYFVVAPSCTSSK